VVYREAVALTDKQLGLSDSSLGPQPSPAGSSSSTSISHLDAAERIRRGRAILTNFRLLRTRLGAPHPAWILINPMLQVGEGKCEGWGQLLPLDGTFHTHLPGLGMHTATMLVVHPQPVVSGQLLPTRMKSHMNMVDHEVAKEMCPHQLCLPVVCT
jgi:hypothetical protein